MIKSIYLKYLNKYKIIKFLNYVLTSITQSLKQIKQETKTQGTAKLFCYIQNDNSLTLINEI